MYLSICILAHCTTYKSAATYLGEIADIPLNDDSRVAMCPTQTGKDRMGLCKPNISSGALYPIYRGDEHRSTDPLLRGQAKFTEALQEEAIGFVIDQYLFRKYNATWGTLFFWQRPSMPAKKSTSNDELHEKLIAELAKRKYGDAPLDYETIKRPKWNPLVIDAEYSRIITAKGDASLKASLEEAGIPGKIDIENLSATITAKFVDEVTDKVFSKIEVSYIEITFADKAEFSPNGPWPNIGCRIVRETGGTDSLYTRGVTGWMIHSIDTESSNLTSKEIESTFAGVFDAVVESYPGLTPEQIKALGRAKIAATANFAITVKTEMNQWAKTNIDSYFYPMWVEARMLTETEYQTLKSRDCKE